MDYDVIIIGAGMSGLTAANYLHGHDLKVKIFEADNEPGGRVRSFKENGFILDRGFQVFLPGYPEARRLLKYEDLDLRFFMNGAYVLDDKPYYIADPIQNPEFIFKTLTGSRPGIKDKLKLFALKSSLGSRSLEDIFSPGHPSTREVLIEKKYSLELIRDFFQPFLSGIFLEKDLNTSSSMFEFVVKMFNEKGAALPAAGISAIPQQLYHNLPPGEVEFGKRVIEISNNTVILEDGEKYTAAHIVLAVEGNSPLLSSSISGLNRSFVGVRNYYYSMGEAFVEEPVLILNPNESSIINNLCIVSRISEKYAPEGKELLSVTVMTTADPGEPEVKKELVRLLGIEAEQYEFIRSFDIEYALPTQKDVNYSRTETEIRPQEGIYLAGDFNLYGSLNAAMTSGREAAELILKDMKL